MERFVSFTADCNPQALGATSRVGPVGCFSSAFTRIVVLMPLSIGPPTGTSELWGQQTSAFPSAVRPHSVPYKYWMSSGVSVSLRSVVITLSHCFTGTQRPRCCSSVMHSCRKESTHKRSLLVAGNALQLQQMWSTYVFHHSLVLQAALT